GSARTSVIDGSYEKAARAAAPVLCSKRRRAHRRPNGRGAWAAPAWTGSTPSSRKPADHALDDVRRGAGTWQRPLHPSRRLTMNVAFPGESAEYRAARDRLLRREIELRRATESVAAARRELPPGGVVPEDYVFQGE